MCKQLVTPEHCPVRAGWKLVLAALCLAAIAMSVPVAQAQPKAASIAPPPMGWSSWNSFSNTVDARIVTAQARAMVASGLKRAGYEYVNIDEGWWLGKRDSRGNIVVSPKAWPALAPGERAGDMANIVRYIHHLGLKAGIYTDAGMGGCNMDPDLGPKYIHAGSQGHYNQDFLQFAKWGFDYVKVDWCGGYGEHLDPAAQYAEIAHAIQRAERLTGHKLYFSICEWGRNSPWTWAPHIGGIDADIWRTSGDIVSPIVAGGPHADRKASFSHMVSNFEHAIHPASQHTGFYNDADMLVAGMPGLTEEQDRVHMALWAVSGAPLILGADLTRLNRATLKIFTNEQMQAVDQDLLGLQAVPVPTPHTGLEVWSKRLATPGERAVVLLNRSATAARFPMHWSDLGLVASSPVQITNIWTGKSFGAVKGSYSTLVPAHDAVFFMLRGKESPAQKYWPEPSQGQAVQGTRVSQYAPVRFAGITARRSWVPYTNSAAHAAVSQ
jgi:hypothetical protein